MATMKKIDIDVETLISKYRDTGRVEGYCRFCNNYGRKWMCPPFLNNEPDIVEKYERASIIVTKVMTDEYGLKYNGPAGAAAEDFIKKLRSGIDEKLRNMEKSLPGSFLLLPGSCLLCGDVPCAREKGRPCIHPDKARPSLESMGFDVSLLLKDLFNMELKWCKDNKLPEYFILVAAILT